MMNRKNFLYALAAVAATSAIPPALARPSMKVSNRYRLTPAYTASTAPDSASRAILTRRPILRLTDGSRGAAFSTRMHGQFAQVLEQNFARVDARVAALMMGHLTDREIANLAQLHTNATAASGLPSRLTEVLAHRLHGKQLARAAAAFGTAPMYESLMRIAPQKLRDLDLAVMHPAPVIGAMTVAAVKSVPDSKLAGQFFNYTVEEIYLSFRTAPIGAMGVAGALWETGMVLGQTAGAAFGFGYAVGSGLAGAIQTKAPDLWDAIGGTIDMMLENIFGPLSAAPGPAEEEMAIAFGLPESTMEAIADTGGDFMVAEAWQEYSGSGGGGGGGACRDCSLI